MKKVLVLVLLSMSMLSCNDSDKKQPDEVKEIRTPKPDSDKFVWKDGYDAFVDVKFTNSVLNQEGYSLSEESLKEISIKALAAAPFRLKNELSFVPIELQVMGYQDSLIVVTVKFRGKNSFGAESNSSGMWVFNRSDELVDEF